MVNLQLLLSSWECKDGEASSKDYHEIHLYVSKGIIKVYGNKGLIIMGQGVYHILKFIDFGHMQ